MKRHQFTETKETETIVRIKVIPTESFAKTVAYLKSSAEIYIKLKGVILNNIVVK